MAKDIIKMPKNTFEKINSKKDNLNKLEKEVIKCVSKFNQYGFFDETEEHFLKENKGKEVSLELMNNITASGILNSIDKYRISLSIDGICNYYYKHAVIAYYIKK